MTSTSPYVTISVDVYSIVTLTHATTKSHNRHGCAASGEIEISIQNVNLAGIEVRCQKEGSVEQRQTLVNRSTSRTIEGYGCCVAGARPAGNKTVFRTKNELPPPKFVPLPLATFPGKQPGLQLPFGLPAAPVWSLRDRCLCFLVVIARMYHRYYWRSRSPIPG
jgi:hypothetical protein